MKERTGKSAEILRMFIGEVEENILVLKAENSSKLPHYEAVLGALKQQWDSDEEDLNFLLMNAEIQLAEGWNGQLRLMESLVDEVKIIPENAFRNYNYWIGVRNAWNFYVEPAKAVTDKINEIQMTEKLTPTETKM